MTDDSILMTTSLAIQTHNLSHHFGSGETRLQVLHHLDLEIPKGQFVILMGPSGSGKTTLLTLVGCLRSVQEGSVKLLGEELSGANERTLMLMRRRLGFIFQAHNLHDSLTAMQNVRMGLDVHGKGHGPEAEAACQHVLELVGLGERVDHYPSQLSGGQKQRVAVARAVVGNPDVLFADEPTAALDKEMGQQVIELIRELANQRRTTVFMVTHDHRILDYADRIINMEDGRIVESRESKVVP